jgi:hypothetical protein
MIRYGPKAAQQVAANPRHRQGWRLNSKKPHSKYALNNFAKRTGSLSQRRSKQPASAC